jgi:hypothetical protein
MTVDLGRPMTDAEAARGSSLREGAAVCEKQQLSERRWEAGRGLGLSHR